MGLRSAFQSRFVMPADASYASSTMTRRFTQKKTRLGAFRSSRPTALASEGADRDVDTGRFAAAGGKSPPRASPLLLRDCGDPFLPGVRGVAVKLAEKIGKLIDRRAVMLSSFLWFAEAVTRVPPNPEDDRADHRRGNRSQTWTCGRGALVPLGGKGGKPSPRAASGRDPGWPRAAAASPRPGLPVPARSINVISSGSGKPMRVQAPR